MLTIDPHFFTFYFLSCSKSHKLGSNSIVIDNSINMNINVINRLFKVIDQNIIYDD